MSVNRRMRKAAWTLPLLAALAGCATVATREEPSPAQPGADLPAGQAPSSAPPSARSGRFYKDDGPGDRPPSDLAQIPDALPKAEPLRRAANRPYKALGRDYAPLTSVQPFRQRGT